MTKESSIEKLKLYVLAHELEEKIHQLIGLVPRENFYPLANNLWRASVAVAHHVAEAHDRYSYTIKIQSLQYGRIAAEETIKLLEEFAKNFEKAGDTAKQLEEEFSVVIKQSWGLIKYFQKKQSEKQQTAGIRAADDLVASRA